MVTSPPESVSVFIPPTLHHSPFFFILVRKICLIIKSFVVLCVLLLNSTPNLTSPRPPRRKSKDHEWLHHPPRAWMFTSSHQPYISPREHECFLFHNNKDDIGFIIKMCDILCSIINNVFFLSRKRIFNRIFINIIKK